MNRQQRRKQNAAARGMGLALGQLSPAAQQELLTTLRRAIVFHQNGDTAGANKNCRRVLQLQPGQPTALFVLGQIAASESKIDVAKQLFENAIASKPDYHEAMLTLAELLIHEKKYLDAKPLLQKSISIHPSSAEAHFNLGLAYQQTGDLDAAQQAMEAALRLKPDFARAMCQLGNHWQSRGDLEKAETYFRQTLAIDPAEALAWYLLASLGKGKLSSNDIACILAQLDQEQTTDGHRIRFHFTLAKSYEDIGEFASAAEHLHKGNKLKFASFTNAPIRHQGSFGAVKETFTRDLFEKMSGCGCLDETPVFIIGMPRSGTTLAEQIIASHPDAYGAGELDLLRDVLKSTFGNFYTPGSGQSLLDVNPDAFAETGLAYVKALRKHSKTARRIINKLPDNYFSVGIIRLILPKATIIHCDRRPEATCLSIYKANFHSDEHQYAYDMDALAERHNGYRHIMDYWHTVLPDFVHDATYEALVADQETNSRRLVDLCGLDWSDECLNFYNNKRDVQTASRVQVRQPIYSKSVALWENYAPFMSPLFDALNATE